MSEALIKSEYLDEQDRRESIELIGRILLQVQYIEQEDFDENLPIKSLIDEDERLKAIELRKKLFASGNHGYNLEEEWKLKAECFGLDPNIFFPAKGKNGTLAKKICKPCEVRQECLEYSLIHSKNYGIWAGKNEKDRRSIRIVKKT